MGGLVGGVVGSVGGLISGGKAASAAKGQAEALRAAANTSYGRAQFNPIGIKTNLGSSNFTMGPDGQLTEAGYSLSPEMQAIQQSLIGQAGQYDPTQIGQYAQPIVGGAQSLFNLGNQYLATSPEQAKADYMTTQRAALAPGREQQLSNIKNSLFQTGRTGLASGGTSTGMMASNPELQAYYNSLQSQDLTLAAQAEAAAQERQKFGAGLFGTGGSLLAQVPALTTAGYSPLQTQLGLANTIEGYGQQPFTLSQGLAGAQSNANAAAGQLYMQPQAAAANAYSQYQGYSPMGSFVQGIGNSIANWQGGGTTNPYANMGIQGNQGTGYTYANQAGPTQSGGNLDGGMAGAGSSGGLFGGISSWFSDIRTKQNIKLIGALANGLNIYEYEYKPEFKDHKLAGHGKFIGVMAQEVEKVIPHAVTTLEDGYKVVNYGAL